MPRVNIGFTIAPPQDVALSFFVFHRPKKEDVTGQKKEKKGRQNAKKAKERKKEEKKENLFTHGSIQ